MNRRDEGPGSRKNQADEDLKREGKIDQPRESSIVEHGKEADAARRDEIKKPLYSSRSMTCGTLHVLPLTLYVSRRRVGVSGRGVEITAKPDAVVTNRSHHFEELELTTTAIR